MDRVGLEMMREGDDMLEEDNNWNVLYVSIKLWKN